MNIPKHSPWGTVQHSEVIADGICFVSTAGHGGVKLDRKHNAAIPAKWRSADGWYEEDCDWAIPAMIHRAKFLEHADRSTYTNRDKVSAEIESTLKNWNPEFFTEVTGQPVTEAESYMLRQKSGRYPVGA